MSEQKIKDMSGLEDKINYHFKNIELLKTALTHSSYCNENRKSGCLESNERSEFLGDAVLSIITSDFLFKKFPDCDEGFLTRTRAALVCEDTLAVFSSEIGLGDYMLFGHGETGSSGGKHRKSIISDAFEALLAAVYLDGGMKQARKFVLPYIKGMLDKVIKTGTEDYKSHLQRIVQETPEEELSYVMTKEEGPPHDRTFYYEVYLNSNLLGSGSGHSKREAEQEAARKALILLGVMDEK